MILIKFRNAILKGFFNILTIFGTHFKVRKSMFLLEEFFSFFLRDFSVFQVTFVPKNDKMKVVFWTKICLGQKLISPLDNLIISLPISKIKNQKTPITTLIKDIQKCPELFLSRRVPNSILVLSIIYYHFARKLIGSDCNPILPLELLINMSIHNRSFSYTF